MWDWVGLVDPDFMLSVVTCEQYGGWSDSGFCDKKYDTMYSKQQLTPNQTKRRAIVWQMQAYLQKTKPYLWLANLDNVSAYGSNWTGIVTSPQGPFNSISKVSLTSIQQK
jgi:peptide/nickel transport system substrate-binding protein